MYYPCMNVAWIEERLVYRDKCMCLYCEDCRGNVNKCRVHMSMTSCDLRSMSVSSFEMSIRFRNLKSLHKASRTTYNKLYREWILEYVDPDRFYRDKLVQNPF